MSSTLPAAYVQIGSLAVGGTTGAQAAFEVSGIYKQTGGRGQDDYARPKVLYVSATQNATTSALRLEWSSDGVTWLTSALDTQGRGEQAFTASGTDITNQASGFTAAGVLAAASASGWIKIPNPPPYIRVNVTAIASSGTATAVNAYAA